MSQKLQEVRKKIDKLDDQIHDLLMERAELVLEIGKEKKKNKIQVVQPDREAVMIRRLMKRHKGPLPEAAVVRIWRELVGAVSLLQTGLSAAVTFQDANTICWDMAKSYFGSVLPMTKSSSPMTAIAAVREGSASFAVVPWPNDNDEEPWWPHLANQGEDKMRVVCALPYGQVKGHSDGAEDKALIISKISFASSGEDHSFIALDVDHNISRARIVDALKTLKLEPLSIHTKAGPDNSLHLIEIDDYLAEDDERLADLPGKFEGGHVRCVPLGGYPVPPVFRPFQKKTEELTAPPLKEASK